MDVLRAEIGAKGKRKHTDHIQHQDADVESLQRSRRHFNSITDLQKPTSQSPTPTSANETYLQSFELAEHSDCNLPSASQSELDPLDVIRELRARGEPIRLFDESNNDRWLRLLEAKRMGKCYDRNQSARVAEGAGTIGMDRDLSRIKGAETKRESQSLSRPPPASTYAGAGMTDVLDLDLIQKDISKVYPIIYHALKGLLRDWEQDIAEKATHAEQNANGVLASTLYAQTAENLRPLFKLLRRRNIEADVLSRLAEIVHCIQKRQYRSANDAYMQLSIGDAPWPIGVTMVGIHERSGREKIYSANVAHILNDETSRKYIQGLKRLMTFAQTKFPPQDISMLMG